MLDMCEPLTQDQQVGGGGPTCPEVPPGRRERRTGRAVPREWGSSQGSRKARPRPAASGWAATSPEGRLILCIQGLSQPCCPPHADRLRACSGPSDLSCLVSSRHPPPEPLHLEGSLPPAGAVAGVVALRTEQGQPTPVPLGASREPPRRSL